MVEKLKESEFIASQFLDLHFKKGKDGFEPCGSAEEGATNVKVEEGKKIPEIFMHNFLQYSRQNIKNLEHKDGLPYINEEQAKKYNVNFKEAPDEKKPKTFAKYTMEKLLGRLSRFIDKYGKKKGDDEFKNWAEATFGEDEIDKRKTSRALFRYKEDTRMTGQDEYVGDNIEFVSDTAGDEITIYFYTPAGTTSSSDTPTEKYCDTSRRRRKFVLRTDQSLQILEENGVVMTDPITVAIGDGSVIPATGKHTERLNSQILVNMKIRCPTANTNVKIRVI